MPLLQKLSQDAFKGKGKTKRDSGGSNLSEDIFNFDISSLNVREEKCCICGSKNPELKINESSNPSYIGRPICSSCNEKREYMKTNDTF
jgi:hypothetical protein